MVIVEKMTNVALLRLRMEMLFLPVTVTARGINWQTGITEMSLEELIVKKGLAFCLAAALVTTTGCGAAPAADEQKQEVKQKVVETYKVKSQATSILLTASGIVEPKEDIILSFGTSGKITQLSVKNGDQVVKGQVLASLDTAYYQQALAAASGQVDEANAQRSKTLKGASQEAIAQQRLQVASVNQRLEKAEADYLQAEKLYTGGAISQNELTDKKRELEQAKISAKNEQIALDKLLKGAEPEDIAAVNASVKQASGQVAQAKKTLQDTKLVAPFAGTIVNVSQTIGESSNPGQEVIHLVDLSEVTIHFDVTNETIAQYRVGEEVSVTNSGGVKSKGKISFVSPVVDAKTGKYRIEVTVSNPDRSWRGGMIGQVEKPRSVNGLVVPLESVGINQANRFVMVIRDGVVKKQEVQVGHVVGEFMEILSGVQVGDQLIRSGITYYVDGEKVVPKGE